MSDPLVIEVVGDPRPQPRHRVATVYGQDKKPLIVNGRAVTRVHSPGGPYAEWRGHVELACRSVANGAPLSGPMRIDVAFRKPRPAAHFGTGRNAGKLKASSPQTWWAGRSDDRDNLDKLILDTLKREGVIQDDGFACDGRITKRYAGLGERPGATICIRRLTENGTNGSDEDEGSLFGDGEAEQRGRLAAGSAVHP